MAGGFFGHRASFGAVRTEKKNQTRKKAQGGFSPLRFFCLRFIFGCLETLTIEAMKEITKEIIEGKNGAFRSVSWQTEKKPSAKFKGISLRKSTRAVVRAGINYANLKDVQEGIANGERGEVQPLPWGQWEKFPYTISHKGKRYVRLYIQGGQIETEYFVNGKKCEKSEFESYLNPSDVGKKNDTGTITVAEENLV